MNGLTLLVGVCVLFLGAYVIYGRCLKRWFGIDPARPCPSKTHEDGIDYVPTPMAVLFGHHFASIAGAGPIVGPILAASMGWCPAMLWIVLGCIFIGSMHDFAALFLSVRNEGRSIAYVIEHELGYYGRQIFLFFCVASLILVVAVFTSQIAESFISTPSVASSSIFFMALAPIFGVLTSRRILSLAEGSLIFVPILFVLVWLGTIVPIDIPKLLGYTPETATSVWIVLLLYYGLCASILPVDFLLQPRDYLNSYLLYAMIILGFVGVVTYRPDINVPAFVTDEPLVPKMFPLLFVTIACGACSGFHALVASGTSSKQIKNEAHILPIGYGAMLIEGLLATLAIISVCYLDLPALREVTKGPAPIAFAKGLATFSAKLGLPYETGLNFVSLSISAFMLTSMDTATRLARFVWQEMLLPRGADPDHPEAAQAQQGKLRRFLSSRWIATLTVVILSGWMIFSGESAQIWPVFGASNQLLAALTLLAVSLWLTRTKRPVLFALLPMILMMVISVWALVFLIIQNINRSISLVTISVFLLAMACILIVLAVKAMAKARKA